MNIETDITRKKRPNFKKMITYGFQKENNTYYYTRKMLNNTFLVQFTLDEMQHLLGKIYDLATNEEYINFHVSSQTGSFVSKVRAEYQNILTDIVNHCFENRDFYSTQANRISKMIHTTYQDKPQFLWDKTPDAAVFKNPINQKWYGIIMNIPRNKIDTGSKQIDILNVKLAPEKIEKLSQHKGFYPAYHMNKKHWITIVLDDTLKDQEIMNYIIESHQYTEIKKK